jgi:hypothetical protein
MMILRTIDVELDRICMGLIYALDRVAYPGDDVPHDLGEWVSVWGVYVFASGF